MSIKVMSQVWEHSTQKGSELITLLAIANYADDEGVAFPSVGSLAQKARMTSRNVQFVIAKLEKSQELSITRNAGPHGCHLYKVTLGENFSGVKRFQGEKISSEKPSGVKRFRGEKSSRGGEIAISPDPSLDPSEDLKPPSPPTVELSPTPLTPAWLMQLYNTATPIDHPKVLVMTEGRTKKAKHYLAMFPDVDFWEAVMRAITASAFLRGRTPSPDHPNFRGNLDWLLTKGKDGTENCVKVREGHYQDGQVIPANTRPWPPISRAQQRNNNNIASAIRLGDLVNGQNGSHNVRDPVEPAGSSLPRRSPRSNPTRLLDRA